MNKEILEASILRKPLTTIGLIVAMAAGSTAYSRSVHGPVIPIGLNVLALTPLSPFLPRCWKGALLTHTSGVSFENLDPQKRPLTVRPTSSISWTA